MRMFASEGIFCGCSPIPSGPPPTFNRDLCNEEIKIGDPLRLSCQGKFLIIADPPFIVLFCAVSVPPWPRSITWYNSLGKIDDQVPNSRYKCLADGLGGYTLEVRPTEAEDQGEWKVVAASDEGAISISTCDIKMISKFTNNQLSSSTVHILLQFPNISRNPGFWTP